MKIICYKYITSILLFTIFLTSPQLIFTQTKVYSPLEIDNHTIPPIIIKSDSSEVETESFLVQPTKLLKNAASTLLLEPLPYTANNLSIEPTVVRILRYNEDTMESHMYGTMDFPNGSQLKIWLQQFDKQSKKWSWINETKPQIQISRNSFKSLVMEFDKTLLEPADNDHPKRLAKYKYSGGNGKILRFGRLQVSGYPVINLEKNGDEYVISFNKH